jgi:hypothetical protein
VDVPKHQGISFLFGALGAFNTAMISPACAPDITLGKFKRSPPSNFTTGRPFNVFATIVGRLVELLVAECVLPGTWLAQAEISPLPSAVTPASAFNHKRIPPAGGVKSSASMVLLIIVYASSSRTMFGTRLIKPRRLKAEIMFD